MVVASVVDKVAAAASEAAAMALVVFLADNSVARTLAARTSVAGKKVAALLVVDVSVADTSVDTHSSAPAASAPASASPDLVALTAHRTLFSFPSLSASTTLFATIHSVSSPVGIATVVLDG